MKPIQFARLLCLSLALTLNAKAGNIPVDCKIGGFAIGCQAWTFNHFSAYEAVELTALAGGKCIEFYPGQNLSPGQPDVPWDHHASDETIAAMKAYLAKHGLRAVNYGVVHGKDEAEWRQIFEFARKLDLYAITTEDVDKLDMIEKLVKEFDIRIAIHNHPRRSDDPDYKVWNPAYVLSIVKDRDPRIGACADIGHWATSGIKPVDAVKILKGRIISAHFKDRLAIGRETPDQPLGSGVCDIRGVLDELKAQGFNGNISIEYDTQWEQCLPDVAQGVGFFRGYDSCK
jgi:sugar phosphate isomerase/epimerase